MDLRRNRVVNGPTLLQAADVSLCPAVCHPLYPTLTGTLPEGGASLRRVGLVFPS